MADKTNETTSVCLEVIQGRGATKKTNTYFEANELRALIEVLTREVTRLSQSHERRSHNRRNFSRRRRSKHPVREAGGKCWYLHTFGAATKPCKSPCSFRK